MSAAMVQFFKPVVQPILILGHGVISSPKLSINAIIVKPRMRILAILELDIKVINCDIQ